MMIRLRVHQEGVQINASFYLTSQQAFIQPIMKRFTENSVHFMEESGGSWIWDESAVPLIRRRSRHVTIGPDANGYVYHIGGEGDDQKIEAWSTDGDLWSPIIFRKESQLALDNWFGYPESFIISQTNNQQTTVLPITTTGVGYLIARVTNIQIPSFSKKGEQNVPQ